MMISSIASMPIFGMLNNEKMTKEEIIECLRKENYEDLDERKVNQENEEFGFETEKNKYLQSKAIKEKVVLS